MEYQERATAFEIEQQCRHGDYIQEEADKKLRKEYDPAKYDNFVYAIAEDALAKHWDTIQDAWECGSKEIVGHMIMTAIYTYWKDKAESEVADEENL